MLPVEYINRNRYGSRLNLVSKILAITYYFVFSDLEGSMIYLARLFGSNIRVLALSHNTVLNDKFVGVVNITTITAIM
jgi:hypothetical protein